MVRRGKWKGWDDKYGTMVVIRVGLGMSQKDQLLTQKEFEDKNSHNAVAEDNLKRVQLVLTDAKKHLIFFNSV